MLQKDINAAVDEKGRKECERQGVTWDHTRRRVRRPKGYGIRNEEVEKEEGEEEEEVNEYGEPVGKDVSGGEGERMGLSGVGMRDERSSSRRRRRRRGRKRRRKRRM